MTLETRSDLQNLYEREMLSRKLSAKFVQEKQEFGVAEFLLRTNVSHPMFVGIDIKTEKETGCVVNLEPQISGEGPAIAYQIWILIKKEDDGGKEKARHRFATLGLQVGEDKTECILEIGDQSFNVEGNLSEGPEELNQLLENSYSNPSA